MFYVGVDFGSTYTTVSVYRPETDTLEAISLSQGGTPFVPSVLALSKEQFSIGSEAKNKNMKGRKAKNIRVFRAFKMLLAQDDLKEANRRGYDKEYTPCRVSGIFLEILLGLILRRENEKEIDQLVVGVPEIWNNELKTVDGRAKLRDICRNFSFIRRDASGEANVQIVSEPAAASAYFSYHFQRKTGQDFEGRLLLVDYGGGTLDITLTDVETRPDQSGRAAMEIQILMRTGAGENEEGQVGKAGIVYMETVARQALLENFPEEEPACDAAYFRVVDELERTLQDCKNDIDSVFGEYGTKEDDLSQEAMDEDDYIFTSVIYKGEEVEIPYRLLVQVYDQVIRGILDEKLNEVMAYMDAHGIDYLDGNNDRFKIALVGGFGNFYLVREQIREKFHLNNTGTDRRQKDIIGSAEECEKAISLGAALLASGVIRIRNTAPYSIGVCAVTGETVSLTYGLELNQDIEFGKVYFQRDKEGNYVRFLSISGGFSRFIVNMKENPRAALIVSPKEEFKAKLSKAVTGTDGIFIVGFSLDSSGVLSLHIHECNIIDNTISEKGNRIELTSFKELFDLNVVEKAYKDE